MRFVACDKVDRRYKVFLSAWTIRGTRVNRDRNGVLRSNVAGLLLALIVWFTGTVAAMPAGHIGPWTRVCAVDSVARLYNRAGGNSDASRSLECWTDLAAPVGVRHMNNLAFKFAQ